MKKKISGIYKITSPSGKIYIGQSISISSRFNQYKNTKEVTGQLLLTRSFLKYGVENHIFEIIEECEIEDLNCRERYWQDYYYCIGKNGLNCVLQMCGEKRVVLSEETRIRKSIAVSGSRNGMYGRKGELNPNYGVKYSEEYKKEISERMKGKYIGELNPFYGKNHSEETLLQLSENAKQRIGEKNSFYGKTHSDEYKQKCSLRMSEFFKNNPEAKLFFKNRLSKGTYHTPKGEFLSQRDACKANGVSKATLRIRCMIKADKVVGYNYQIPDEYRGDKTWREHGWFFTPKKEEPKPNN